jgi:DNA-binding PadR family transcriptional regulator
MEEVLSGDRSESGENKAGSRMLIRGNFAHAQMPFPNIDEPPLGYVQFIVLTALEKLGPDKASGAAVIDKISSDLKGAVQGALIYTAIRKLVGRKFIVETGVEPGTHPPRKLYTVTPPGSDARAATADHYREMAAYIREAL